MAKDMVILGAGGFGREASLLIEEINADSNTRERFNLLGFIDGDQAKWGKKLRGYKVLGDWEALNELPGEVAVICVVGDPSAKKRMVEEARARGRKFVNLVHPGVGLGIDNEIGRGVLINKGCLLTTNIRIGDHVSINPGCGIGHDAIIEDYTTLMWRVNVSGNVKIGEGCLIGTGATVLQGKTIGKNSTIGAGAVVTKDFPEGSTLVGVPAIIAKQM